MNIIITTKSWISDKVNFHSELCSVFPSPLGINIYPGNPKIYPNSLLYSRLVVIWNQNLKTDITKRFWNRNFTQRTRIRIGTLFLYRNRAHIIFGSKSLLRTNKLYEHAKTCNQQVASKTLNRKIIFKKGRDALEINSVVMIFRTRKYIKQVLKQ